MKRHCEQYTKARYLKIYRNTVVIFNPRYNPNLLNQFHRLLRRFWSYYDFFKYVCYSDSKFIVKGNSLASDYRNFVERYCHSKDSNVTI